MIARKPSTPTTPRCTDPEETPPACGECGGETFWHVEPDEEPELVCLECVAFTYIE
jgi:hypothetical protein